MQKFDVIVIGGGPAGLSAALAAEQEGAKVLLVEREERLGGILKQCIHDGFGLIRFGEKLTGPEYVEYFIELFEERQIKSKVQAFVTEIVKEGKGFIVSVVDKEGITDYKTRAIVLATGCRERTSKQVSIHGTRPAGIFTAGTAQHFVNLLGEMPARRCVILGSGDIGLIMARRFTLEGAQVLGVYEAKPEPSGLTRNVMQCLEDFKIPLYLSHTVTKVYGDERLLGVEIARVDDKMRPIPGTEYRVDCDTLILSVGLIPENEIAEKLGVKIDAATKGPMCDSNLMTTVEGVFSCGNALHVNDLVDYVTESGETAGKNAAQYQGEKTRYLFLNTDDNFQYLVPQRICLNKTEQPVTIYFRSRRSMESAELVFTVNGKEVFKKRYRNLKPPEMERVVLDIKPFGINENSEISVTLTQDLNSSL